MPGLAEEQCDCVLHHCLYSALPTRIRSFTLSFLSNALKAGCGRAAADPTEPLLLRHFMYSGVALMSSFIVDNWGSRSLFLLLKSWTALQSFSRLVTYSHNALWIKCFHLFRSQSIFSVSIRDTGACHLLSSCLLCYVLNTGAARQMAGSEAFLGLYSCIHEQL